MTVNNVMIKDVFFIDFIFSLFIMLLLNVSNKSLAIEKPG